MSMMAALMWASWRYKNLAIHEKERPKSVMLAAGYCKMVVEFKLYASKVFKRSVAAAVGSRFSSWKRPPVGCIKANVDAHVPAADMTSVGVVCRNSHGTIILAATKTVIASTPECVEAMVVRYTLQLARRFGHERLWVESDASNVVTAINAKEYGLSHINVIYDDVRFGGVLIGVL